MSWKIFDRTGHTQHDGLLRLNDAGVPPWRTSNRSLKLVQPDLSPAFLDHEKQRAAPFLPSEEMERAVNAALYLRRPILITGKPGVGKSTLISKVAYQLKMGPVLRWSITSRTTLKSGIYEYDAVGRLQAGEKSGIADYLTLGPLGTALMSGDWPRALLMDEIDKSDLDLANDLLNVIEEGQYVIPELYRLRKVQPKVTVRDAYEGEVDIPEGRLQTGQFPFVVMTSNAEREFPPAFLRRTIRIHVKPPTETELTAIVERHLGTLVDTGDKELQQLVSQFCGRLQTEELATDQLLNAIFLVHGRTGGQPRHFDKGELEALVHQLTKDLSEK